MISIPTTLILGAGASCPDGYPSGAALRKLLCEQYQRDAGPAFDVLKSLDFASRDIVGFRDAFYRSQITSIDRFLAINKQYWQVGKAAIAALLIQSEVEDNLLRERSTDHWYRYLWNRMETSWEGFLSNAIRIVTFNYDRSLEMFLAIALSSYNGRPFEEAVVRVYQLPIVHVYGSLGLIGPDMVAPARPYSNELREGAVKIAMDSIRVIPEHRRIEEDEKKIKHLIASAQRICYLGFGYDALNVEHLCLNEALPDIPNLAATVDEAGAFHHGKDVLGTTVGLKSQEVVTGVKAVKGRMQRFAASECEDFLRVYGVL